MATIIFLFVASVGLITTFTLFKFISRNGGYSLKVSSFVLAVGIGITWFLSFVTTLAVVNNYSMEFKLFEYILIISIVVVVLTFFITLFLMTYLDKNRKKT